MPGNPVQILLNDGDFLRAPDPGRGGPNKEFFPDDAAFVAHRDKIADMVARVVRQVEKSDYGPATYLRVRMRALALAKSYRPNKALLKPDRFPCVGAEGIGILLVRAPLLYLGRLEAQIRGAEAKVRWEYDASKEKREPRPTRVRSEVGAIEAIEIAPAEEKRTFSAAAAVQMLQDPRAVSGYQIELFETRGEDAISDSPLGLSALHQSLRELFLQVGGARFLVSNQMGRMPSIELQLGLEEGDRTPMIELLDGTLGTRVGARPPALRRDLDPDRHEAILSKLAAHPLVRAIRPPIRLAVGEVGAGAGPDAGADEIALPVRLEGAIYPRIGVIDGGVSNVLSNWTIGRYDQLTEDDCDPSHGTRVAGLLVAAQAMNSPVIAPERDGAEVYDAALFPGDPDDFFALYPNGFTDFIAEMASMVAEAKRDHGVRVFNLSINAVAEVEPHRYSLYAARVDEIADEHDVLIVNSAGNLDGPGMRRPWQPTPRAVMSYLATRSGRDEGIYTPAESVRSLSVGAINPPGAGQVDGAPASYSRRGPGLQVGVKPDLAAYGGTCGDGGKPTGLNTVAADGTVDCVQGTSFAAPMVARVVAGLDAETGGRLSVEALRAMTIHHAAPPGPFASTRLHAMRTLGRGFCGFGRPGAVADMLETGDHRFTMLFQSRLTMGERRPAIMRFPFQWPRCLTNDDGGCSGDVRLTLVYAPPLNPAFGAEFVRVNLDAVLAQRQPKDCKDGLPSFRNEIEPDHKPQTRNMRMNERALIEHGLKWWPTKRFCGRFALPRGSSSTWRLEVTSIVRAEATFPVAGVPFAVVLTIEDPDGIKPVFAEMRQSLGQVQARTQDIRATTRLRPRGR